METTGAEAPSRDAMNPMSMSDITQHPNYKEALAFVQAQANHEKMEPPAFANRIRQTIASLTGVSHPISEAVSIDNWPMPVSVDAWKQSIEKDSITCLICGKKYKIIGEPHIMSHGGSKADYKRHFGIPSGTPLASLSLVDKRRKDMMTSRIWERKKDKTEQPDIGALLDQKIDAPIRFAPGRQDELPEQRGGIDIREAIDRLDRSTDVYIPLQSPARNEDDE